jgi:PD-(D/E)XK nuclease superfamily
LLAPIHEAQVLSYLRLSGCKLALLINFNVTVLKDGIRRFIEGPSEDLMPGLSNGGSGSCRKGFNPESTQAMHQTYCGS